MIFAYVFLANFPWQCGDTALIFASLRGPRVIVELLLEAGADKDIEDMVRQSYSHICVQELRFVRFTLFASLVCIHYGRPGKRLST